MDYLSPVIEVWFKKKQEVMCKAKSYTSAIDVLCGAFSRRFSVPMSDILDAAYFIHIMSTLDNSNGKNIFWCDVMWCIHNKVQAVNHTPDALEDGDCVPQPWIVASEASKLSQSTTSCWKWSMYPCIGPEHVAPWCKYQSLHFIKIDSTLECVSRCSLLSL